MKLWQGQWVTQARHKAYWLLLVACAQHLVSTVDACSVKSMSALIITTNPEESVHYIYIIHLLFIQFSSGFFYYCGSLIQVNSTSTASSFLFLGNKYNEVKGFPSGLHISPIAWFIKIRLLNSDLEDLSWLWSTGVVPWDPPESGKEFKMADNSSSLKVLQATHKMGFSI